MIAGRYSLDREIGRGGMGAVWLGRDETLGRPVALKRVGLMPGVDGIDLARAEREAHLTARLNHPHVVSVFDFVADSGTGARWLVMEYVNGVTVADLVRERGGLSPDDAAPMLLQVADALAAAHAAGIVHRDVKPSNILVDRGGQAKLTDFGIARGAADATLTQTGLLTGSPAYLPPEVANGERGDESVDVWSLGATIFYVLSGRAPYETGDNPLSTLYRIVHDDPPRLADAGWMGPLVGSTMVKDPSARWSMQQVRDFLADPASRSLAPLSAPASALASEPEPTQRMSVVARRQSRGWWVAGLALVALVAVALYAGLHDGGSPGKETAAPPSTAASGHSPTTKNSPAGPTAKGMKTFIRDYVAAVSANPRTSWQMLTPKFQEASGGFDTYRAFWTRARHGRVLSIRADPETMVVRYHVHFDNFDNGPGPTILKLVYRDGQYRIDEEHTKGFVPAD